MALLVPPFTFNGVIGSGAPTDASFANTPPDGTPYIDASTNLFYVRIKGTWQLLAPGSAVNLEDPTGLIAESWPRQVVVANDNNTPLASGTLFLVGVVLPAGVTVNKVQFLAGATAEATGTHAWTCLLDNTLVCRAVSADNTAAGAVGASALFGAAFAASYTTTYDGLYYAGINVTATTPPSLISTATLAAITGLTPKVSGASTTGNTTPITTGGAAQTAITASAQVPYVQVS